MSVSLLLVRKFHSYFFEYYLPVVLVVLISWLPFWLDRVLILRIYVAFCTTIFLSWHLVVKPNEVIVSYITLLDFWRVINLLFVFVAAFESVFITYIIKTNRNCIKRTCKEDNEKFQMLARGNNYPEKVSQCNDGRDFLMCKNQIVAATNLSPISEHMTKWIVVKLLSNQIDTQSEFEGFKIYIK